MAGNRMGRVALNIWALKIRDKSLGGRGLGALALPVLGKAVSLSALCLALAHPLKAETMSGALSKAYRSSPELNAQRADVRATDENLPAAKGGFRPNIYSTGNWGFLNQHLSLGSASQSSQTHPGGINLVVNQNLFNGFRDLNGINRAEFQIKQSQQLLRNSEASVLSAAAAAYMKVLRDTSIVLLRTDAVEALELQLSSTQIRLDRGEVSRTDVSQAQSALAQGRGDLSVARASLLGSQAVFKQLIGETPKQLTPARAIDGLIPRSLPESLKIADREHPLILAANFSIEAAELSAQIAKGQLLPTLNLVGTWSRAQDYSAVAREYNTNASIVAQLNVPIYEAGIGYAQSRQAIEKLSQTRILADQQRMQIHMTIESFWANRDAIRETIKAASDQVEASEATLNGVREEAKFGERTTQDILYAQQLLTNSRVGLINTQHDRVVISYNLVAAIGRLSAESLNLAVEKYDPKAHYDQVQNKWIGFD
mgnify:CR=1 FL=1